MEELYNEIRNNAAGFFKPGRVNWFIEQIDAWNFPYDGHFFQLTQVDEEPRLEFAAHVEHAIVDFTVEPDESHTTILAVKSIAYVRRTEKMGTSSLHLHTSGSMALGPTGVLVYRATGKKSRDSLGRFASYVEALVTEGRD